MPERVNTPDARGQRFAEAERSPPAASAGPCSLVHPWSMFLTVHQVHVAKTLEKDPHEGRNAFPEDSQAPEIE